jgi:hypothetical protein
MLVDRGFPVQAFEYQHATPGEAVVGDGCQDDSEA